MRRSNEHHFYRSLGGFFTAVLLLGLLQISCSRHDSDETVAKTPPVNTNPPVIEKIVVITNTVTVTNPPVVAPPAVSSNVLEHAGAKGIGGEDTVAVAKTVTIPPPYHQVFVLCVGINSNPAYGNLHFAVGDATSVANTFRNVYGFTNVTLLTNNFATRSNVLAALTDIQGRLSKATNDDFIFYFSGHGATWNEPVTSDGKTNITRHGFLVAYDDATNPPAKLADFQQKNLEITALATAVIQLPARHRLMFLDSCFSGLAYVNQDVATKPPDDFNPQIINHRTVEIMTAGLASEEALEDSHEGHGIFTAALLKQLTSDDILTMDEVFFPLRVTVRKSLRHVEGGRVMTPQLRYLVADNGTFLFVPTDQLPVWATEKSDNAGLAEADTKGYLNPVTIADVTNVFNATNASPAQQQELVDRYEARASMGDPCATIALAQMYKNGIGVPPDPARAKLYTSESSDLLTAGNLNIAALAGITNPILQALVGDLVKGYNLNDLFQPSATGNFGNQTTLLAAQEGIKIAKPMFSAVSTWATGFFSRSPVKGLASRQKKVKSLLANPTAKNITAAKKELNSCEDDLAKLDNLWPTNQPAEVGDLKKLVQETEIELDQNHPDLASASIDKVAPDIDALQNIIKSQAAAAKKK